MTRLGAALLAGGLLLLSACAWEEDPALTLVGRHVWADPADGHHRGFSAIEVSDDGSSFLALTDRAFLYRGSFQRGPDGAITAVASKGPEHILSDNARHFDELNADLEGLAWADDGKIWFSDEGYHYVIFIDPHTRLTQWVRPPPDFQSFPSNRGIEALALDDQGRVIAIPEGVHDAGFRFPVYRFDGTTWTQPYKVQGDFFFVPVGADTGPDGRLYLLERGYVPWIGFASRLRSFAFGPEGLSDERLLLRTGLGDFGNFEGIAVSRIGDGALRLTLITDSGAEAAGQTEIVEFRLADAPALASAPQT